MMTVNERIDSLRNLMKERKIDIYIIPMSDFHSSEYVGDYFKEVEFISGFTGTNATVAISQTEAGLWTDGRYFIQARREMKDTYLKLFEMGTEGVPTIYEYIEDKLPQNGCLGFDGRLFAENLAKKFECAVAEKEGSLKTDENLLDFIWTDRPSLPNTKLWILQDQFAGETLSDKLSWLRSQMKEKNAQAHLLTSLYDIAWLFNMRADDISRVPVFMSYVYVTADACKLYINEQALTEDVKKYLKENNISVKDYYEIYEDMKKESVASVLVNPDVVNRNLCKAFPETVELIFDDNPTELKKAVKNSVEIENTKKAHVKDGVALTKFIYYIKKNIGKTEMDEISVSDVLESYRRQQENFLDLSFDTIAAFGPNAAMMHYTATKDNFSKLEPRSFLLVDSGGHYLEGTTDVTRTIVLGPLTEKEKRYFTISLRSHLRLEAAHFLDGTTGQNLDILARGPVWDEGLDYRCGTGHGVGHILNVHEGPNSFRWKLTSKMATYPIKPGMITTDEPGLYVEDECGIRHENELLCVEAEKTEYGQFYKFEPLTFAPIDLDAVIVDMLTEYEKKTLNDYHALVFEKIAPFMNGEELEWLKDATRAI